MVQINLWMLTGAVGLYILNLTDLTLRQIRELLTAVIQLAVSNLYVMGNNACALTRSVLCYGVTPLLFPYIEKEQNSSYLQLRSKLNGKMLVLAFVYSNSTSIVQQKNATKPARQTIMFFVKY